MNGFAIRMGKKKGLCLYRKMQVIGRGGCGTVYSAVRRSDGLRVAIKKIAVNNCAMCNCTVAQIVPLEVSMLQQVKNVHEVIQLIDYFECDGMVYIVMERVDGQDMFDFICERGTLTEEMARNFFKQIVDAVFHCHERGVLHGDIKDDNIMIDLTTGRIKLIDFGCAAHLHSHTYGQYNSTIVCSPPEWIIYKRYTAEGLTAWTLGILLYNMLCGDVPFSDDIEIMQGNLIWDEKLNLSDMVKCLIEKCLDRDLSKRLTLKQIREHSWLREACEDWVSPRPMQRSIECKIL